MIIGFFPQGYDVLRFLLQEGGALATVTLIFSKSPKSPEEVINGHSSELNRPQRHGEKCVNSVFILCVCACYVLHCVCAAFLALTNLNKLPSKGA